MAWISGRTISPANGELVFVIDENANLPSAAQNWEQLWQICKGIEPIVPVGEEGGFQVARHSDETDKEKFHCRDDFLHGRHIQIRPQDEHASQFESEEIEPQSECEATRRTLTFRMVNFDINDNGESIATTTGCVGRNCDQIAISLRTRGKNPLHSTLNSMFPNDFMRAIGWQESRWNHFLPNGKPKSNRNTNGTTDWGLMQINEATYEQQWNWKSNLARAITLFEEKRDQATRYLNQHPQGISAEMLENEAIQRYNGGRYHVWDAGEGVWKAAPGNNYVASIRAIMTSRPW